VLRAQRDGPPGCGNSLVQLTQLEESAAEVVLVVRSRRVEGDGPAEGGDGLVPLAQRGQRNSLAAVGQRILRVDFHYLAPVHEGLARSPELGQEVAELSVNRCVAGSDLEGPPVAGDH